MKPWFLYLIECTDGSIYTGITTDVDARFAAHAAGRGARYTRARPPRRLLGWQAHADRAAASRAEYRVKSLSTVKKHQFAEQLAMQIQFAPIVDLLHSAPHAVLCTQSTQLPGYPYGTAVPLVVDGQQQPLLLISALAEHTRNLLADPRASLAVVATGQANVQDAARLTLLGDCRPHAASAAETARYLRYLPAAEHYLQLDFQFFRFIPQRARYIGGVGRMGWLDASAWQALPGLDADAEAALLDEFSGQLADGQRLLGIDACGADLDDGGQRRRLAFAGTASDTAAMRSALAAALAA